MDDNDDDDELEEVVAEEVERDVLDLTQESQRDADGGGGGEVEALLPVVGTQGSEAA
jgi:hypothetical protein